MKSYVKNITKTGMLMFAVGALLAMAAPFIATQVGLAGSAAAAAEVLGHTANPIWMGSFFGAFGAIQSGLAPIFNNLLGGEPPPAKTAEKEKSQRIVIAIQPAVAAAPEQSQSNYRESVKSQRETSSRVPLK